MLKILLGIVIGFIIGISIHNEINFSIRFNDDEIVKQKDKLINLMAEEFINKTLMYNDWLKDDLIQYFEERCK